MLAQLLCISDCYLLSKEDLVIERGGWAGYTGEKIRNGFQSDH